MWSLVIAKDLFSQFNKESLLAPGGAALRYRTKILARGGAAPASTLVQDFLGRPFNFKAYQDWLNEGGVSRQIARRMEPPVLHGTVQK